MSVTDILALAGVILGVLAIILILTKKDTWQESRIEDIEKELNRQEDILRNSEA